MQIVIDIDKEDWKDINDIHFIREDLKFKIGKAIMNGTPLPKGHGRLIDASEKVTMQIFDDEYEEISEKTMTIEDSLALYADGGYTTIIEADKEK